MALIEAQLEAGLRAQHIHKDLVAEVGFTSSYQSVKRFVRHYRGFAPERVWRIKVQPGEEAQVNFGTGGWVIDPVTGARRRPQVIRVVQSFSNKAYSESFFRQDTEQVIRGLEGEWQAFGGVPRTLKIDYVLRHRIGHDFRGDPTEEEECVVVRCQGVSQLLAEG